MLTTSDIKYQADIPLVGHLASDDTTNSKRPGILLCHEGNGLGEHAKERARRLAGLGYVAFCLDMFGVPFESIEQGSKIIRALRADLDKLRARALAGLDFLAHQQQTDSAKLAAIGFCFGGTTALEIARSGAEVKGVVSFHGVLDTLRPADAKNIKGKILICTGAEDPLANRERRGIFEQEMQEHNVDWRMIVYGRAAHSFTNKDVDALSYPGFAYDKYADECSWRDRLAFFDEIFAA